MSYDNIIIRYIPIYCQGGAFYWIRFILLFHKISEKSVVKKILVWKNWRKSVVSVNPC
nr:MAG TPA: hypothetical protein [Caudoviricetes sp.]